MKKTHKDLDVWKKAIEFVTMIYRMTSNFPKEEIYGLINQLRRAAVSIPSNISEGAARNSDKELLQYLYISRASVVEIETQLIIAHNLNYLKNEDLFIIEQLKSIIRMLTSFINKVKERIV